MRQMFGLKGAEGLEQGTCPGGVVAIAVELCDPGFLLHNMPLAQGNVPFGLLQLAELHVALHGATIRLVWPWRTSGRLLNRSAQGEVRIAQPCCDPARRVGGDAKFCYLTNASGQALSANRESRCKYE